IVLRQSRIEAGKVTIPPGALGYVTETWPPALPLRQDVIYIADVPNVLVDIDQSIVTRKNVTLVPGDGTTLGSEVFRLRSVTEFGDARSAVIEVSALSGFDWARLGTGSLEVSTTEPGWHAKTFHYGMHQGRVEEVTAKSVRFAWLSGLRTDAVVLAEKREFAALVGNSTEIPLADGAVVRVVRVNGAAKQIDLQTPDGPKVLSANVDLRGLPADTAARKKLIAVWANHAIVLVPDASEFATNRAHIEVYSGLRHFRHGGVAPAAANWRAYPFAHYTGGVVGIYWVNEQPIDLTPNASVLTGPYDSFKILSTWNSSGEISTFQLQDAKGGKSAAIDANGRKSINLLAGNGPTLHSILARIGVSSIQDLHQRLAKAASAPKAPLIAAPPPAAVERQARVTNLEDWRDPRRLWFELAAACIGLLIGLPFGILFGRARRRPRRATYLDDD
ncbi:MAG TPA: hypothetical protein VIV60_27795, partial [Polyangiaceae bacterium]